jgi:solute:Na+ symporter, SSS family
MNLIECFLEQITMDSTHFVDAVIVVLYLVLAFGIGIFARKLLHTEGGGEDGYFLAGRKIRGWLNGLSFAVTCMNSDVAPAYCGMAVVVGLSVSWFYLSRFGLALLIVGMLFAVRWRQMNIKTGPEFFALRYGGRGGKFIRVYTSLFTVFVGMVPWIGAGMLGVHMIFGPIFGIESKLVTLSLVLPVLLIYVWISGFAGVLVTDVMQTLIILLASLVLIFQVLVHFGGPSGLTAALQQAHPENYGDILSALPVPGHQVLGPLVVLAWCIVPTIGVGGGAVAMEGQRIFSCRDHREAAKVFVWGEIGLFAMLLLLTLPVLGALVNHPHLYTAGPAERETVYGLLLNDFLPTGLLGLALAALCASVMSTIDSHMNFGAQTLLNDVYRPLVGEPSEKKALWLGRLLMIVILASSVAVVYFSKSLIGIAVVLTGIFGSAAAFGWGQWWWWRVNLYSWVAASVGGPVVYFTLGGVLKHNSWWQAQLSLGENMVQGMAMFQAVIAMTITTLIWVAVTLVTRPEKEEVLKKFYLRARPMGLWGPVRRAIEEEQGATLPPAPKGLIPAGFGASLLGFGMIALGVLSISELFVGRYGMSALLALGAAVLAVAFKFVFNWHLGRLD